MSKEMPGKEKPVVLPRNTEVTLFVEHGHATDRGYVSGLSEIADIRLPKKTEGHLNYADSTSTLFSPDSAEKRAILTQIQNCYEERTPLLEKTLKGEPLSEEERARKKALEQKGMAHFKDLKSVETELAKGLLTGHEDELNARHIKPESVTSVTLVKKISDHR